MARATRFDRHEIDYGGRGFVCFDDGLKNECVGAIASRDARVWVSGRYFPMAIRRFAEQGGEHGSGIEPWPAQPVDRPVSSDQRRRFTITDECVVLDALGHGSERVTRWLCRHSRGNERIE